MLKLNTRRWVAVLATFLLCGLLVFLSACSDNKKSTVNRTTFSAVMFTGDSLTAGFQSGSLWQKTQVNGYAPLIAKQAGFPIIQPLIADPGIPAALELVSFGPPPIIQPMPGTSTGRINQLMWPTDVAVPGHRLNDVLTYAPVVPPVTGEDIITDVVLAYPPGQTGTQLQQVIDANPTLVILWIGNNDVLDADIAGTPAVMTSTADFTTQFTSLMGSLTSKTSAKIIVANIPDVTVVPYLTPAPVIIAEAAAALHITPAQASAALGIVPGDYVNANGLAELESILAGAPLHALPLIDSEVLSASEVTAVQAQVTADNAIIAAQASSAGATLVDINALFTAIGDCRIPGLPCSGGITINGVQATNGFLGGLFSLDGIHPTNTGYAIIANTFIDAMNASLSTSVPKVDVSAVAAADPLFPPNIVPVGGAKPARISAAAARRAEVISRVQAPKYPKH